MIPVFVPGKQLICCVGRHKGEALVAVTKQAGARGGTIAYGRALVDSKILQALSLADVHQEVVFTLMCDEADAVIEAVRRTGREEPKKMGGGIAMVLNVPGMMIRKNPQEGETVATELPQTRSERMESGYTLLTVIVNNGYAEDVMAVARKAGASGGTILTARGTGTEADVKFFGVTLVPEKEMLMIVAEQDKVDAILAAIRTVPTLNQPGGGIVYAQHVEQFIVLGKDAA